MSKEAMKLEMVDDEGENQAVRMFLALYGGACGVTAEQMRKHLKMAGFDHAWPIWATADGHLTKAGAQLWIRHLLELEQPAQSKPYAYEYGRDNGDGTYSVVIEKGDLVQTAPAVYNYVRPRNAHKDWPIKELFDRPPAQQETKKLKVTLEDRPIDIELAQYKRMFEAACSALGSIGDALGVDPEEGGADPILMAIAELKPCATCEALARTVMLDQTSHDTSPPAQRTWVGLMDEEIDDLSREMVKGKKSVNWLSYSIEAKLKEKNA